MNVAVELFNKIGATAFAEVAAWLRDIASGGALEVDGVVCSPSVAWLAESITFFDPSTSDNTDSSVSP